MTRHVLTLSLYARKLLARRAAGHEIGEPIPPMMTPLKPFPLHGLLRVVQAAMYR